MARSASGNSTSDYWASILGPSHSDPAATQRVGTKDPDTGPGWFGSSWELERGLVIEESMPSDATLDEWLAAHLPG